MTPASRYRTPPSSRGLALRSLGLAAALALALPAPAPARTLVLRSDGTGDVPTFQAGVDSLLKGTAAYDTLLVLPGSYNETVDVSGRTTGSGGAIICPGGPERTSVQAIHFATSGNGYGSPLGLMIDGLAVEELVLDPHTENIWLHCRFNGGLATQDYGGTTYHYDYCEFRGPTRLSGDCYANGCRFVGTTVTTEPGGFATDFDSCAFEGPSDPAILARGYQDGGVGIHNGVFRGVTRAVLIDESSVLGYLSITSCHFEDIAGAAIEQKSRPGLEIGLHSSTFDRCGRAVYCRGQRGAELFIDADTVRDCAFGAIDAWVGGRVSVAGLRIERSGGPGIALTAATVPWRPDHPQTGSVTVELSNCSVTDAAGDGIVVDEQPSPELVGRRATLSGVCVSRAGGRGLVVYADDLSVRNTIVEGCQSDGLVASPAPRPTGPLEPAPAAVFDHNTLAGNGGVGWSFTNEVGRNDLTCSLTSNLSVANGGSGFVSGSGFALAASRNDAWMNVRDAYAGFVGGDSNLTVDPQLCDPTAGNFQVATSSQCAPTAPLGQIGALGVGCDAPNLDARLWKPDGPPIFRGHHERVPLAILGSRYFDVANVNTPSVRLAGATPLTRGPHEERSRIDDLDHDGYPDLLLWFDFDDLQLGHGESSASVEATTREGARYVGRVQLGSSRGALADELEDVRPWTSNAPVFALLGATPNPSPAGPLAVRLSLPTDEPARLELLDIAGRRVRAMDLAGAGERVVRFDVAPGTPAGLYWLRLAQGAEAATTRVAVLR